MSHMAFGSILREARERKGMDVQSAARKLRIRPDILRAIENNDFSRMPPRGYTRNMVNAYARLVGLNPSEITRMFLDEQYAYQVGRSRSEADSPTHVSGRKSVSSQRSSRSQQRSSREDAREGSQRRRSGEGRPSRSSSGRSRQQRPEAYRESLASRAARADDSARKGRIGSTLTTQFTNFYSGSASLGSSAGRTTRAPYLIVAAVILVLLVIIIAMAFGNHGSSASQDVPKVPVTGVTDTSADGSGTSSSESAAETAASTVAVPTSVKVEYKLASGQQAYVVITNDDESTESMLTGPVNETVEVSGTWSLASYVSDAFTVTMDGKEVSFEVDSTTGMPTATVNFSDYLKTWASEHPNVKVDLTQSSTSSSGSSTTTSTGSSSTSGTGSTTGSSTGTTSLGSSSSSGSTTSSTGSSSSTSA